MSIVGDPRPLVMQRHYGFQFCKMSFQCRLLLRYQWLVATACRTLSSLNLICVAILKYVRCIRALPTVVYVSAGRSRRRLADDIPTAAGTPFDRRCRLAAFVASRMSMAVHRRLSSAAFPCHRIIINSVTDGVSKG